MEKFLLMSQTGNCLSEYKGLSLWLMCSDQRVQWQMLNEFFLTNCQLLSDHVKQLHSSPLSNHTVLFTFIS